MYINRNWYVVYKDVEIVYYIFYTYNIYIYLYVLYTSSLLLFEWSNNIEACSTTISYQVITPGTWAYKLSIASEAYIDVYIYIYIHTLINQIIFLFIEIY